MPAKTPTRVVTLNSRFQTRPRRAPESSQVSALARRLALLERAPRKPPAPKAAIAKPRPAARSLYAQALLDPINGPSVGVPTTVPVQTFVTKVKCSTIVTTTTGSMTAILQPVFMMSSDGAGKIVNSSNATVSTSGIGPMFITDQTSGIPGSMSVLGATPFSNAPYASADFANNSTTTNVRGRIVGCAFRACNTSADNDRNGTFTCYADPGHLALQAKTSSDIAKQAKAVRFAASSNDWHTVMYHPVDPDEVEGWVSDPFIGPAGNYRSAAYNTGATLDGVPGDLQPGYMGIWWNGDSTKPQSFLIEAYAIVEYIGSKVAPMVRDNPSSGEVAHHAHTLAESSTVHRSSQGDAGTGHPLLHRIVGVAEKTVEFANTKEGQALISLMRVGSKLV